MKQIITSLNSSNNRIKALFLNAHGSPFGIDFGTIDDPIFITPLNRILHESLDMIDSKAFVALHSCSTGKERIFPCFARILSYYHPGQTIIAPTTDVDHVAAFTEKLERSKHFSIQVHSGIQNNLNWTFFHKGRRIPPQNLYTNS